MTHPSDHRRGVRAAAGHRLHLLRHQVLPHPAAHLGLLRRIHRGRRRGDNLFGDGFLSTITGWFVGFVLGAIFAACPTSTTTSPIVILGGGLGFMLSAAVFAWLGNGGDWLTFIVNLGVAIVFAVAFIVLQMPLIVAIVATAIAGASSIVVGLTLALGRVPLAYVRQRHRSAPTSGMTCRGCGSRSGWCSPSPARGTSRSRSSRQWIDPASQYRNPGMPVSS